MILDDIRMLHLLATPQQGANMQILQQINLHLPSAFLQATQYHDNFDF